MAVKPVLLVAPCSTKTDRYDAYEPFETFAYCESDLDWEGTAWEDDDPKDGFAIFTFMPERFDSGYLGGSAGKLRDEARRRLIDEYKQFVTQDKTKEPTQLW